VARQGAWPGWVRLGWVWSGLAGSGKGEGAASAAAFRFREPRSHARWARLRRYVGLMARPELLPSVNPRDQSRLSSITVLTWIAGFNLALTAGVLWRASCHTERRERAAIPILQRLPLVHPAA
jgi:hypothetical protein